MLRAAKIINSFIVAIMLLEIMGSVFIGFPSSCDHKLSIHNQKSAASVIAAFICEKAEEENEKTENEKAHSERMILIDFSRVAFTLSLRHTPTHTALPITSHYDLRPPVYTLNCVFLI